MMERSFGKIARCDAMNNIPNTFHVDGKAHCEQCAKVVEIQQGSTVRDLRSSWLRMTVSCRVGHRWVIAIG